MAAVTFHCDFGAQENEIFHCFYFFPFYLPWSDGTRCHDFSFLNVEFQASFFHSPFTSSRISSVPLWFLPLWWYHVHIWGCCCFSWQFWFQLVIHPAWHFALYSAYKLNRQGDNYNLDVLLSQFWNVCCSVSGSVTSWPTYRLLRRQVWWSGIPISLRIFHSLLWSTQSKALA